MNSFDVPSVQESKNIIQANYFVEWRPPLVRIIMFFLFASYIYIWMVFNILIFFPSQVLQGIREGAEHTNLQKVAKFEEKVYFCSNICFLAEMPA